MTQWLPATSSDKVHCIHCGNAVDTPEEIASFPEGNCPDCGNNWTGTEIRETRIMVTAPKAIEGQA